MIQQKTNTDEQLQGRTPDPFLWIISILIYSINTDYYLNLINIMVCGESEQFPCGS